jgi:hypothetical protein
VAEVARQRHDLHARVVRGDVGHPRGGGVAGAVVDQDQLVVDAVQRRRDALGEARHDLLLFVHRGDDAEQAELALHRASVPS